MNQTNLSTTTVATTVSSLPGLRVNYFTVIKLIELGFGIISNLINIFVFLSPRLKDTTYIYMLTTSCANFAYQFFHFIFAITDFCQSYCVTYQSYFLALYSLAIYNYFVTCLAFFRTEVDVLLSLHTYCILANRNWLRRISWKWILPLFFVIAVVIYLDKPTSATIVATVNNRTGAITYSQRSTSLANTDLYDTIAILNTSLRVFLIVFVLTAINAVNVYEFRKRYLKRHRVGIFLQVQTIHNLGI
jgi:hypothetical protein